MASVTIRKEERKTIGVQEGCVEIQDSLNEDGLLNSINSLEAEEKNLAAQKENLKALLQQLETKAREEVEKRKRKVESLNLEVSDLKQKCKKFASWINSDPSLGRNKADL